MIELTARYLATVWQAPDRAALIGRIVTTDGERLAVKAPGDMAPPLQQDVSYRFHGSWEEHPRYGRQFKCDAYTVALAADRKGIVAYLMAVAENVGEKRAGRLHDEFGARAVEVLREEPSRVAAAGIMPQSEAEAASATLVREQKFEATKVELLAILHGRGFQVGKVINHAIGKWGVRAPAIVRRNPYALLLGRAPSVGWKRADRLYLDLGLPKDRLKRQALAALYHLKEERSGHTWHDAESVARAVEAAVGADADPMAAFRLAIRARLLALRRGRGDERWLAEARNARAEHTVTDKTKELSSWARRWPLDEQSLRARLILTLTTTGSTA